MNNITNINEAQSLNYFQAIFLYIFMIISINFIKHYAVISNCPKQNYETCYNGNNKIADEITSTVMIILSVILFSISIFGKNMIEKYVILVMQILSIIIFIIENYKIITRDNSFNNRTYSNVEFANIFIAIFSFSFFFTGFFA